MPKDMQCAFVIESVLGVCEIVNYKTGLQLPCVSIGQSKNKILFLTISEQYGANTLRKNSLLAKRCLQPFLKTHEIELLI